MRVSRYLSNCSMLLIAPLAAAAGADGPSKDLLDLKGLDVSKRLSPNYGSEPQVSAEVSRDPAAAGLEIPIAPGKADYPGVNLKPADGVAWDLSAFGHVEARVVNTGSRAARFALRVDNSGPWRKGPWNTEEVRTGRGIERERRPLGQGVHS